MKQKPHEKGSKSAYCNYCYGTFSLKISTGGQLKHIKSSGVPKPATETKPNPETFWFLVLKFFGSGFGFWFLVLDFRVSGFGFWFLVSVSGWFLFC